METAPPWISITQTSKHSKTQSWSWKTWLKQNASLFCLHYRLYFVTNQTGYSMELIRLWNKEKKERKSPNIIFNPTIAVRETYRNREKCSISSIHAIDQIWLECPDRSANPLFPIGLAITQTTQNRFRSGKTQPKSRLKTKTPESKTRFWNYDAALQLDSRLADSDVTGIARIDQKIDHFNDSDARTFRQVTESREFSRIRKMQDRKILSFSATSSTTSTTRTSGATWTSCTCPERWGPGSPEPWTKRRLSSKRPRWTWSPAQRSRSCSMQTSSRRICTPSSTDTTETRGRSCQFSHRAVKYRRSGTCQVRITKINCYYEKYEYPKLPLQRGLAACSKRETQHPILRDTSTENLKFLTSRQAIEDIAYFIKARIRIWISRRF